MAIRESVYREPSARPVRRHKTYHSDPTLLSSHSGWLWYRECRQCSRGKPLTLVSGDIAGTAGEGNQSGEASDERSKERTRPKPDCRQTSGDSQRTSRWCLIGSSDSHRTRIWRCYLNMTRGQL